MQDSENDIDNKFRNAAEHYLPNDGDSKWPELYPQLLSSKPAIVEEIAKNNYKKYLLFGLCLLISFFTGNFFVKKTVRPNQSILLNYRKDAKENKPIVKEETAFSKTRSTDVNKPVKKLFIIDVDAFLKKSNLTTFSTVGEKEDYTNVGTNFFRQQGKTILNEEQEKNELNNVQKKQDPLVQQQANIIESNVPGVTIKLPGKQQSVAKETDSTIKNLEVITHHNLQKPYRLYVGIAAGPTYNQVKNQGFEKPGISAGIIAGYQINNRVAIETGLSLSKKYYYSDARYVTMDKIHSSMPVGMEVLSIEGSSMMLEIPLKLKYSVFKKNNLVVFSSAGISSYLMTNEKNDYLTLMNGSKQNIIGSYNTPSKYLAASFNSSVGYENKIGKATTIRIEPFINIPLRGVGVGSMQVMSAGVQVGIIKLIR